MGDNQKFTSRRTVLKGIFASGALGYAGISPASAGAGSSIADFGDGIAGWRSGGPNKISRISEDEVPGSDFSGGHALLTEVNRYPASLETTKDVVNRNLSDAEYIIADCLVVDGGTDGEVNFELELHHTDTPPNSPNRGGGRGRNSSLVKDVGGFRAPQMTFTQVYWDVSEIPDSVLEEAKKLRISWEPVDDKNGNGPGNSPGSNPGDTDDLLGQLLLDGVRYVTDASEVDAALSVEAMNSLRRKHGRIVGREVDITDEEYEEGRVILRDGTELNYSFEIVGDRKYIQTIDGEEFRLGEGW